MSPENTLLKPNIEPFDSNVQRIRRNLLITSCITFIFTVASNGIDNGGSLLGIKFKNLDPNYINTLIILSLLYFLIHFIWSVLDHFKENTLMLTGVAIPTAKNTFELHSSTLEPNTTDYKQSTLSSWVAGEIDKISKENISFKEITTEQLDERLQYIEMALKQYEKGFWFHQRSQLIRWCILDCGIPVLVALVSMVVAIIKVINCS